MVLRLLSEPAERRLYACREPDCVIRYDGPQGYFLDAGDAKTNDLELIPRVSCINDGQRMYLAEVTPEKRNFRLWKCPECSQTWINNENTSGELGKEAGA